MQKEEKERTYKILGGIEMLEIILIIILSPLLLIFGLFSLFIILGITYSIISIPIDLIKMLGNKIKSKTKKQVEVDG